MATTASFLFAFLSLASAAPSSPSEVYADLILKNGKIYAEHDTGQTAWAQAISVREGNILSIGTNRSVESEKGPNTKVVDLNGRVVLPGFNDAHLHLIAGGLTLMRVDLNGTENTAQIQERLKAYAQSHQGRGWIYGQGWDLANFTAKQKSLPTKQDLDSVVTDRPVLLWAADHRMLLLNSKALETLHINSKSQNSKSGEIQKDDKDEPTGILTDDAALAVEVKVDNPSQDELRQAIRLAQDQLSQFGVTSIQGQIHGEDEIQLLEELVHANQLRTRYALWGDLEKPQEFLALKEKYKYLPEEWIQFVAVKGYLDGVLSTRTAALLEPYSDDQKTRGEPLYTQEKLNELVLNANRLGIPVALHAVGDRAVSMAVIAFNAAKKQLFNSRLRNRIEHAEVVPPYIYPKFAEANIIVSMQPSHMIYESQAKNYNEARLGPQRVKNAFAWKNFIKARAHLAFGTGWPVMPPNPTINLFAAVFRQHYDGKPSRGWMPEQKITMEQAIEAYTLGSAYATREDHVKGSLREGKYADMVVMEKDPFKAHGLELLRIPVYMTIVAGKTVYDGSVAQIKAAR